jgi:hypothetical protein
MRISQLEFGSLLTYCPRGESEEAINSKDVMLALKGDRFVVEKPPMLMSEWIANAISIHRTTLPFGSFFNVDTILIPIPKSTLMRPDTLWVPERIASAIASKGLVKEAVPCLVRKTPVPKSATSPPSLRPTPEVHYNSMIVQGSLTDPSEIVLVDDIITRGSTLLGAANRLVEMYPRARIRAFAAMRTISNSSDFNKLIDPCVGSIELRATGDTLRRP